MSPQCIQPGQGCWRCELRCQGGSLGVDTVAVLTSLGHQQSCHFPTHEEAAQNLSCRSCCTLCRPQRWQTFSTSMLEGLCVTRCCLMCRLQRRVRGLCWRTHRTVGPLRGHWWQLQSSRHRERWVPLHHLPTLSLPSICTPCTPTGTLPGFVIVGLHSLTAADISHTKTITQTWRMLLCCRHLWLQAHAALLQLHQHAGASDVHSRHCW